MSLPLVISTSSWTLMQFTDRMFLLWHSADEMAAAVPASLLSFVVICFLMGVASYCNTFVSQYFGAQHPERIGVTVWQGVFLGALATPLIIATIPLAPLLFRWVGHPPRVMQQEVIYYQVLCWGDGLVVVTAALSSFFTGRGKMRTVMVVDSSAALLNVVLDYYWIFGCAGFPEWGIAGAAWATVVSQWCKTLVYFWLFLRPAYRAEFGTLRGLRFDPALFRRLVRFGSPNGLQFLLEAGAFTMFLFLVGRLGTLELSATNLAVNVNMLAFIPVFGFGIAATTLVGQRLGENRPDLAERATWTTFQLATIYTVAVASLYVLVPDLILWGHSQSDDVASFAALRGLTVDLLWFVAAYCVFDTMNVVFVSALKGAGDTRFVLYNSLIMSSAMVTATYLGVQRFGLGVRGAWCILSGWVLALGVIYFARFLQGKWRLMRVIETQYQLPGLESSDLHLAGVPEAAPAANLAPADAC